MMRPKEDLTFYNEKKKSICFHIVNEDIFAYYDDQS